MLAVTSVAELLMAGVLVLDLWILEYATYYIVNGPSGCKVSFLEKTGLGFFGGVEETSPADATAVWVALRFSP